MTGYLEILGPMYYSWLSTEIAIINGWCLKTINFECDPDLWSRNPNHTQIAAKIQSVVSCGTRRKKLSPESF